VNALPRAHQELKAASLLADAGLGAAAVSRAWKAAALAVEAAITETGDAKRAAGGVAGTFLQQVVKKGGLDPSVARLWRSLWERERLADTAGIDVSPERSRAAVADAERVVAATAEWLDRKA